MATIQCIEKYAKDVANRAMDQFEIEGKTLREWVRIIAAEEWAPVIHAKWLSGDCKGAHCSNCEEYTAFIYGTYDYCPHCGAKMDKEKTDGTNEHI